MQRTGDQKLMQELNQHIILNTIRRRGPISRSEIAKINKLSPTTVASAVNELLGRGIVTELGSGRSSGGRKPILLKFEPDNHFIIGVAVTNIDVTVAEMNLEAKIRKKRKATLQNVKGQKAIARILEILERFLDGYSDLNNCIGISISVPGIVDPDKGWVLYTEQLELRDVPLRDLIQSRFGVKVWTDNDVNAVVLAEKNLGGYHQCRNLLYLKVSEAVGAGIVMNGSIYRGFHGGAGEMGYMTADKSKLPGSSGRSDILINWKQIYNWICRSIDGGKQTAMLDMTGGAVTDITPQVFIQAINSGDKLAHSILDSMSVHLADTLINLIYLLDPEVVLLGGSLINGNDLLINRINHYISTTLMPVMKEGLIVREASFGEDFEVIGTAAVVLHDYFQNPVVAKS